MSRDFMQEMQAVFFEEGRQLLNELEEVFLSLENRAESGALDASLLDQIFRNAHNLKGSAASVGLTRLSGLAHAMEDLFAQFKAGKLPITRARSSVILRAVDEFRKDIDARAADPSFDRPLDGILHELKAALKESDSVEKEREGAREGAREDERGAALRTRSVPPVAEAGPSRPSEEKTIRVPTGKLDSLLNLIGELVVNQSMMISHRVNETTDSEHAIQTMVYMEKLVGELQTLAMTLRMVPVKPLFQKMARVIRDASVALEKPVNFVTEGDHVELDKTVIDLMVDPLTHLIRNAIDHGVDPVGERQALGKPELAQLRLEASQKDDRIEIRIVDDGRGMDPGKLKAKAVEKGLLEAARATDLTDSQAFSLIFLPGFSTKEQVTDLSGRGVGMDVVQRAVRDLKGEITIDSHLRKGTTFTISLPLSLSIIPGLVVNVDDRKYVIPISQLSEIIEVHKFSLHASTQRGRMIDLRGEVIPVHSLGELLHGRSRPGTGNARGGSRYRPGVVVAQHGRKLTVEVDQIIGQQQIVIKKLGSEIMGIPGILGGAVLSNGEPAMILDLMEVLGDPLLEGVPHAAAA
jgi:two-component system chemotaxis sensor kinase CheA